MFEKLDKNHVLLNQSVKDIKIHKNIVQINVKKVFEGNVVVLTIPPNLWARKILFEPNLPIELMNIAKHTHTRMEDSIKIALTYRQPFCNKKIYLELYSAM